MAVLTQQNLKEVMNDQLLFNCLNICILAMFVFFFFMLSGMIRRIVVILRRRDLFLARLFNNNDVYIPAGVPLNGEINIIDENGIKYFRTFNTAGAKGPKATPPPSNGNA